jgi:hypothetical protein
MCDFAVLAEVVVDNEYITTYFDKAGNPTRAHISGRLVVRLTNMETDASVVRNISGPGTLLFGDRFVLKATGPWLFAFLPGELGPGSPPMLIINKGQFWLGTRGGHQAILRQTGTQEDVCATLA